MNANNFTEKVILLPKKAEELTKGDIQESVGLVKLVCLFTAPLSNHI